MASKFNFTQVIKEPTRTSGGHSSLIDHVYLSDPRLLHSCCTVPPLGSSDHNSLLVSLAWSHAPARKIRRTFWRFTAADHASIHEDLQRLPSTILHSDDVNSFWSLWRDFFLSVISKHIPHKQILVKKTLPWLTQDLKSLTQKRDLLYRKAKLSNSSSAWVSFRKARSKAVSALRTAKKTFLQNLSSLVRTPRKFWSAYYSLRPNRQRIPVHLNNGPVTAESVQNKCDLLNSFFASTFSHSLPVSPQTIAAQSLPALESISCSSEDIRKLLTSMPSKTASGPDGISSQMLKISASSVAPQLSALFNLSLSSGSVPTDWKLSNITPVYKAGDPSLVSNYRPISLLSLPSKILERIVHNKLLDYFLSNSLLFRSQFGFQPSSSTQEALISATTDWHKLLDSMANVAAVFFDLSKAFDSIPHSSILNALSGVGISGSLHQWFASYLSNRRQCVVLDGCSSTPADVSSGVPQGSILGPLLVILYMDSITLVQLSPDTKILLYADDILLYSPLSIIWYFDLPIRCGLYFSVGLSITSQTQCCQNQACSIL